MTSKWSQYWEALGYNHPEFAERIQGGETLNAVFNEQWKLYRAHAQEQFGYEYQEARRKKDVARIAFAKGVERHAIGAG